MTAIAALALMLGVFMIALGATDPDPSEGVFGYILGAIGIAAWIPLVIVAGRMLITGTPGQRWVWGILPALVSAAWCGLAAGLLMGGLAGLFVPLGSVWPSALAPLWSITVVSVLTAGTIPVALVLLVATIVLRLARARRATPLQPLG